MPTDSSHLQNDDFGYSCYTLVIPLPDGLREQLNRIEQQAGQTRAKIAGHVTVKGTFHNIESLSDIRRDIGRLIAGYERFSVSFRGMEVRWSEERGFGGLLLNVSSTLKALHGDLVAELSGVCKTVYPDDPYVAHVTVVQEVKPEGVLVAKQMLGDVDFGESFLVESVDLMGRIGAAYGGHWSLIDRFPLV